MFALLSVGIKGCEAQEGQAVEADIYMQLSFTQPDTRLAVPCMISPICEHKIKRCKGFCLIAGASVYICRLLVLVVHSCHTHWLSLNMFQYSIAIIMSSVV